MPDVIERTTDTGARVRVEIETDAHGIAHVIDWKRKPRNAQHWQRVRRLIGQEFPLHQLTGPAAVVADDGPTPRDGLEALRARWAAATRDDEERAIALDLVPALETEIDRLEALVTELEAALHHTDLARLEALRESTQRSHA